MNTELFLDGHRGQYLPQNFAEMIDPKDWTGIESAYLDTLKEGPESEFYRDTWIQVLDNAETHDGRTLHQGESGDLFLIDVDAARDALNARIAAYVEHEETNFDSGWNYGELVQDIDESQLAEQLDGIDTKGLEIGQVAEIALKLFKMVSGYSIWTPYGIILDSFHIGEIEIQIDLDDIADEIAAESCDAYYSGTDLFYVTSDVVWFAVVDPTELQTAINERAES